MRKVLFLLTAMLTTCTILAFSGCSFSPSIGPKVEDHYVILKAGMPCRILDDVKSKTQPLAAEKVDGAPLKGLVDQNIAGWVAMPPEHWATVEKKLKRLAELEPAAPKKE